MLVRIFKHIASSTCKSQIQQCITTITTIPYRYNLKRKIAGLPPVTREWYDARRAQLTSTSSAPVQRVWFDPLTKKKFYSENTYQAFTRSKKYQELVKKSNKPAPIAVVTLRKLDDGSTATTAATVTLEQPTSTSAPTGYTIKPASQRPSDPDLQQATKKASEDETNNEAEYGSEWETASEEEMEGADQDSWQPWDVCRSLFDNHVSASMEANLEYMWKKFGFYLPDSKYLIDPEGLLQYLGTKLQYGHIPLYESGDNPNAKQFTSLHAVQRHMIDSNRCKILFDENEDEYDDYYEFYEEDTDGGMDIDGVEAKGMTGSSSSKALVQTFEVEDAAAVALGGYELAVPSKRGHGVRYLGTREFARYYKQKHRTGDDRSSAVAARVVAQYRNLAVPLLGDGSVGAEEKKRAQRAVQRAERMRLAASLRRNANDNLPKNVPY